MDPGIFELRTVGDLMEKLRWERGNLAAHPGNTWHAFNFFVTAEHVADWCGRRGLWRSEPLLRVCSHIANGGKHFEVDPRRHGSVAGTHHDGVFERGVFEEGVFEESLVVRLAPGEAEALGAEAVDAVDLAGRVLAFWEEELGR